MNISEKFQVENVVVIPLRKKITPENKDSKSFNGKSEKTIKKKERKVICTYCNLPFANETILEGHINRKHSKIERQKKWKCTECDECFSFEDQLENHMNKIHLNDDMKSYAYCLFVLLD